MARETSFEKTCSFAVPRRADGFSGLFRARDFPDADNSQLFHLKNFCSESLTDLLLKDAVVSDKVQVTSYDQVEIGGSCSECEKFHHKILDPRHHLYGRGTYVVIDDVPVGYVKYSGDRTFLATRSVVNTDGSIPLLKYGIYCIKNVPSYNRTFDWTHVQRDVLEISPIMRLLSSELFAHPTYAPNVYMKLEREYKKFYARYVKEQSRLWVT